jgi:hypothetical protein
MRPEPAAAGDATSKTALHRGASCLQRRTGRLLLVCLGQKCSGFDFGIRPSAHVRRRTLHSDRPNLKKDLAKASAKVSLDFVLPNPNHPPIHCPKLSKVSTVSQTVSCNFRSPKRLQFIAPGWKAMPVPKIPIHEYR